MIASVRQAFRSLFVSMLSFTRRFFFFPTEFAFVDRRFAETNGLSLPETDRTWSSGP